MSEAKAESAEGAEAPAKKGGKGKLFLIIGLAVVVLGGGVGGFLFWKSGQSKDHAAEKEKPAVKVPLQFVTLEPAFVVNFEAAQAVRFLQIEVRLASRDPQVVEMLTHNDPVIRNDLLLLFGNQDYQKVSTRAGKEKLRGDTLAVVRKIIKNEGGDPAKVEGVYFTSFVMQ
jgi:flagellar FliL protein